LCVSELVHLVAISPAPPLPPANRNDFAEKPVNEDLCKEELDKKDGFRFDRKADTPGENDSNPTRQAGDQQEHRDGLAHRGVEEFRTNYGALDGIHARPNRDNHERGTNHRGNERNSVVKHFHFGLFTVGAVYDRAQSSKDPPRESPRLRTSDRNESGNAQD